MVAGNPPGQKLVTAYAMIQRDDRLRSVLLSRALGIPIELAHFDAGSL